MSKGKKPASPAPKKPVKGGGGPSGGLFDGIGSFFDGKPGNTLFGGGGTYHGSPSDQPSYQEWLKKGKPMPGKPMPGKPMPGKPKPISGGPSVQDKIGGGKPGGWANPGINKPGQGGNPIKGKPVPIGKPGPFDKPGKGVKPVNGSKGGNPGITNAPALGGGGVGSRGGGGFGLGTGGGTPPPMQNFDTGYMNPEANFWEGDTLRIPYFDNPQQGGQQPPAYQPPSYRPNPNRQLPQAPVVGGQPVGGGGGSFNQNPFIPDFSQLTPEQIGQARDVLGQIMPQQPQIDLSGIQSQLDALSQQVSATPSPAVPQPVDISPIMDRIGALESRLPTQPASPQPISFDPVLDRLNRVEQTLGRFDERLGQPEPAPQFDPSVLQQMQSDIMAGIDERFANLPKPQPTTQVDLSGIQNQIGSLTDRLNSFQNNDRLDMLIANQNDIRQQLGSIPQAPPPQQIDYGKINQMLDQRFSALPQPAAPQVDLSGIQGQLGQLQNQFQSFQSRPAPAIDYNRIGSMIDQRVSGIPQVDLSGIQQQLAALSSPTVNSFGGF
jgi:hypothetical protein